MTEVKTLVERARRILLANRYLSMATCDNGDVWIAPLAYVIETNRDLLYYSATNATHSRHIANNPKVACSIFDSTASSDEVDGIQFSAYANEVHFSELPRVLLHYFTTSFPDEAVRKRWIRSVVDFHGSAPQRFYRLRIDKLYTINLDSPKIDVRVEVPLDELNIMHQSR